MGEGQKVSSLSSFGHSHPCKEHCNQSALPVCIIVDKHIGCRCFLLNEELLFVKFKLVISHLFGFRQQTMCVYFYINSKRW